MQNIHKMHPSLALRFRRHPHISINRGTKSSKPRTSSSSRLRPSLCSQNASRNTPGHHAVRQIILRPQPFYAALAAGIQRTDESKVLGR